MLTQLRLIGLERCHLLGVGLGVLVQGGLHGLDLTLKLGDTGLAGADGFLADFHVGLGRLHLLAVLGVHACQRLLQLRDVGLQRLFLGQVRCVVGGGSYFDPGNLVSDNEPIPPPDPEHFYYTDAISDHAVQFIDQHDAQKPFFMYVAYTAAHWPMHAKPADIAKYEGRFDAGWDQLREERYDRMLKLGVIGPSAKLSPHVKDWTNAADQQWEADGMEVYAAMVDCMDQGVGRIVDALRKRGQLDNTLILYLQDNGGCQEQGNKMRPQPTTVAGNDNPAPPMGPDELQFALTPRHTRDGRPVRIGHGVTPGPPDTYMEYGIEWANLSNTPFRLYKHFVHEGGISTPLIAHWPAGISRHGELEPQPGHLIDVMATCVDLAQADYPGESATGEPIHPAEGVSLTPAFRGESLNRPNPIFWEHEGHRAIRVGDWKLVSRARTYQGKTGPWQLYDLSRDRSEMNDLAKQFPERVNEMSAQWQAWAERANVLPLMPEWRPKSKRDEAAD